MSIRTFLGSLAAAGVGATVVVATVLAAVAFAGDTPKTGHPHFDDRGALSWSRKLSDAQTAAKNADKMIFIEYGRAGWGNCKALVEGVLSDPAVKERIGKLAVGLSAECDPPGEEEAVRTLMTSNLPGAGTLPFAAFVTPDLKWVAGFSGYKDASAFAAVLDQAEKSPLLNASPETAKKLDVLATQAAEAATKALWPKVFAAAKSAAAMNGRSPAREKIAAAVAQARAFAETELAKALDAVTSGGDRTAARNALRKLVSALPGEPEAKEAEAGVKAIERFGVIEAVPADKQEAAREKAIKDFAGTRWTALFLKAEPKPAEKPAEDEGSAPPK